MGWLSSIFGTDPDYTKGDMARRQWKPLDPRPLYDWETVTADGRVITKTQADQEIANDMVKRASDKAAFPGPPLQTTEPVDKKKGSNLFDRMLTGIKTGQDSGN